MSGATYKLSPRGVNRFVDYMIANPPPTDFPVLYDRGLMIKWRNAERGRDEFLRRRARRTQRGRR